MVDAPTNGISYAMMVPSEPNGGHIDHDKISMLAIDLAKGSFQVCALAPEGTVLYNDALS